MNADGSASLARRLAAVTDPRQQHVLVQEHFEGHSPDVLVAHIEELLAGALRGGEMRAAWLPFITALQADAIPYARTEALYRHAANVESDLVRMLLIGQDATRLKATEKDFRLDPLSEELTLGERKAKARSHKREVLERLILDPDPAVVAILLINPRTTEAQVLRLAAHRPNRAPVLRQVARSVRWVSRARIRSALVFNPYTPVRDAVGLIPLLPLGELRSICVDKKLHVVLNDFARRLLHLRRPRPTPEVGRIDTDASSAELLQRLGVETV